jgi:hypothetical protein
MKPLVNKDTNFSLHNIENYKKEFTCDICEVTNKYSQVLIEYYRFILENLKVKNESFARFIILRGVDTITNVFLNIFLYTKNIDITYFHCQKSFYFYVEFVGQITEDEKMFLQLTSRDASIYVYRKTIFEINNDFRKINETSSELSREKMDIVNNYIHLYKIYINKIIDNNNIKTTNMYIDIFQKISEKLNYSLANKIKIKELERVTEKIYNNINNIDLFYNITELIIKKFIKNPNILDNNQKKFLEEDFTENNYDSADKFISKFFG